METTCSLCWSGSQQKENGMVLFHLVENMTEGGRPELVVCADSPLKPPGQVVALKSRDTLKANPRTTFHAWLGGNLWTRTKSRSSRT
jgi:hypothetical protein